MSSKVSSFLFWAPRMAGIAATLLLSLFAFDALDGRPVREVAADLAIHLVPAALCGAAVALAWWLPRVGAALFGLLAIGYALSVPSRPDWIAVMCVWSPARRSLVHSKT